MMNPLHVCERALLYGMLRAPQNNTQYNLRRVFIQKKSVLRVAYNCVLRCTVSLPHLLVNSCERFVQLLMIVCYQCRYIFSLVRDTEISTMTATLEPNVGL